MLHFFPPNLIDFLALIQGVEIENFRFLIFAIILGKVRVTKVPKLNEKTALELGNLCFVDHKI